MKRRHLAALVVLVLVVVGVAGTWKQLWMRWAYEEVENVWRIRCAEPPNRNGITIAWTEDGPTAGPIDDWRLRVFKKQYEWVSGAPYFVPDQVCPGCQMGRHAACFPQATKWAGCIPPVGFHRTLPC